MYVFRLPSKRILLMALNAELFLLSIKCLLIFLLAPFSVYSPLGVANRFLTGVCKVQSFAMVSPLVWKGCD